jgi:hypothetical protein
MTTQIDTAITPPDVIDGDDDGTDLPSARIGCHVITCDDISYDAGVQLFGEKADDPSECADALLRTALALAALRGPEFAWAAMQRFTAYDGMPR